MWNQFNTDEGFKQARPLRKLQMVDKLVRNCPVGITDTKHTRTTMRFCFRYSRIMFQKKKKKIYSVWSSDYPPPPPSLSLRFWSEIQVQIESQNYAHLSSWPGVPLTTDPSGFWSFCTVLWQAVVLVKSLWETTSPSGWHLILLSAQDNFNPKAEYRKWEQNVGKKNTPLLVGT